LHVVFMQSRKLTDELGGWAAALKDKGKEVMKKSSWTAEEAALKLEYLFLE
jgi:hypothetical protein